MKRSIAFAMGMAGMLMLSAPLWAEDKTQATERLEERLMLDMQQQQGKMKQERMQQQRQNQHRYQYQHQQGGQGSGAAPPVGNRGDLGGQRFGGKAGGAGPRR